MRRGSISSELLVCDGGERSILLFSLVTSYLDRCVYMARVCFYVCCMDYVWACGNVCCVAAVVEDSVFSLVVLNYVVFFVKGM